VRRTSLPVPSGSLNGNLDELIYFHNRLPLLMAVESQNPPALTKSDLADPPDTEFAQIAEKNNGRHACWWLISGEIFSRVNEQSVPRD